jgi:polyhydroxybutyrate depolymerase
MQRSCSWVRNGLLAIAWMVAFGVCAGGEELLKFSHQGVERTAVLHHPATTQGSPHPLVIALHGLSDTGEKFRGWAGLDVVADREGLIADYPSALEGRWSYGRPIADPMPVVGATTVDDLGFIRLLIDDLVIRKLADPARIYVAGTSRGGLMAYTVACALADQIAAAAPLITGMTDYQREDCSPARPVPIMVIAGTNDPVQAYDGWLLANGRLLSVPETMELWRPLHGCTKQDGKLLPHRDNGDRTRVVLIEWSNCRSGAHLRLYRVNDGGHQIPSLTGTNNPMSEQRFGFRNRDIEMAEEVWAFFKSYSR